MKLSDGAGIEGLGDRPFKNETRELARAGTFLCVLSECPLGPKGQVNRDEPDEVSGSRKVYCGLPGGGAIGGTAGGAGSTGGSVAFAGIFRV